MAAFSSWLRFPQLKLAGLIPEDCDRFYAVAHDEIGATGKLIEDGRVEKATYRLRFAWEALRTLRVFSSDWHKDAVELQMSKALELAEGCLQKLEPVFTAKSVLSADEYRITKPEDLIAAAFDAQLKAVKATATMDLMDAAMQRRRGAELTEMMRNSRDPQLVMSAAILDKSLANLASSLSKP